MYQPITINIMQNYHFQNFFLQNQYILTDLKYFKIFLYANDVQTYLCIQLIYYVMISIKKK